MTPENTMAEKDVAAALRPQVITDASSMRQWSDEAHQRGLRIGFVPTMGSLHAGHLALVDQAIQAADVVVVSIFVNPLQFGPGEDFERYPRQVEADIEALSNRYPSGRGVDVVFVPGVDDVYPDGPSATATISAGAMGEVLEGAIRPGHFDGVLTVVKRLFDLVGCDAAVFGKKDAQQLVLIEKMVRDHNLPVTIARGDIVRDRDALALSSRNIYLTPDQRQQALVLSTQLHHLATSNKPLEQLVKARAAISQTVGVELDYLEAVSSETLQPWQENSPGQMVIVGAIRVGTTRLIDNVWWQTDATVWPQ